VIETFHAKQIISNLNVMQGYDEVVAVSRYRCFSGIEMLLLLTLKAYFSRKHTIY
jgi:hypothetical protein